MILQRLSHAWRILLGRHTPEHSNAELRWTLTMCQHENARLRGLLVECRERGRESVAEKE
jgi:hypothetical protein